MAFNQKPKSTFPKVSTNIRSIKSDLGQIKFSLFNDMLQLQFTSAVGKDDKGRIIYENDMKKSPSVKMSYGVAAGVANLIRNAVIPAADKGENTTIRVLTFKRGAYEYYLTFQINNGEVIAVGTSTENGQTLNSSYSFPKTVAYKGNEPIASHGELIALSNLLTEVSGSISILPHITRYNDAIVQTMQSNNPSGNNNFYGNKTYNAPQPLPPIQTSSLEDYAF
jgi:hypothetical protein